MVSLFRSAKHLRPTTGAEERWGCKSRARSNPGLPVGCSWELDAGHPLDSIDNPGIMSSRAIQGLIPIGSLQER